MLPHSHAFKKVIQYFTTAVEDIDKKAPTKTPSEALPPHDCKKSQLLKLKCKKRALQNFIIKFLSEK